MKSVFKHARMHTINSHFTTKIKIDASKCELEYLLMAATNNLDRIRVLLKLYTVITDTHSWWAKWLGATQCLLSKLSTWQIAQGLIKKMALPNMVATHTAIGLGYNCKTHTQLLPSIGNTITELAAQPGPFLHRAERRLRWKQGHVLLGSAKHPGL